MNNIGDKGAKMISEALKNNSKLTELGLGGDEKNKRNRRNIEEIKKKRMIMKKEINR